MREGVLACVRSCQGFEAERRMAGGLKRRCFSSYDQMERVPRKSLETMDLPSWRKRAAVGRAGRSFWVATGWAADLKRRMERSRPEVTMLPSGAKSTLRTPGDLRRKDLRPLDSLVPS